MKVKAVLFDLDGTLLASDFEEQINAYMRRLVTYVQRHLPAYAATLPRDINKAIMELLSDPCPDTTVADKFWARYCIRTGAVRQEMEPVLNRFYETEYGEVGASYRPVPQMLEAVALCRRRGNKTAVATNSLYPLSAIEWRIRWAGLKPADFDCITHYDNMRFAKPNPAYYREAAALLGVPEQACVMVGNDIDNDMIAAQTGMRTFLLTDFLEGMEEYTGPRGGYDMLLEWMETL